MDRSTVPYRKIRFGIFSAAVQAASIAQEEKKGTSAGEILWESQKIQSRQARVSGLGELNGRCSDPLSARDSERV